MGEAERKAMDRQIEDRIRARAHELWEADGRPEGRDLLHRLTPMVEVAAEKPAAGEEDEKEHGEKEHGQIVAPTPPQGQ